MTAILRRVQPLAALVIVTLAMATLGARQSQPQTFRSAVDLIAVDVEVVDRDGRPVAGLGPEKFEVTINGRKRRVVSADLIRASGSTASSTPPSQLSLGAAAAATPAPAPVVQPGRVVILAVDCTSFGPGVARGAMVAAKTFVARLPPDDMVGLFVYPLGPKIDPTMDRTAVDHALDLVKGQGATGVEGEFHLRPSELVDLAAWVDSMPNQLGGDLAAKICGADIPCLTRLRDYVKGESLAYEGQGYASLSMLRSLLRGLAALPGRKTVALVSGGTVTSDRLSGHPDLTGIGIEVGRAAAEANVAIYTLFIDQSLLNQNAAETQRANVSLGFVARDSEVLGRWLDMFTGTAGGSLIKVQVDSGESAFDRLLTEMSAYYLLGVEPVESDRDGRPHEMRVKVAERSATVHSRSWVVVPKRGATVAAPVPATATPGASSTATPVTSPPPRPLPVSVQPLAAAFERADYAGMHHGLAAANDLANVIGDFRASDNPWPAAPKRTAVFALELSLAGLARRNGFARDQGITLLAEYLTIVRQAAVDDPFECAWYLTAVAGLEGLRIYNPALVLVTRALQRCPAEPRFVLARALIAEQQQVGSGRPGDVLLLYDAAMKFAETGPEARVRAAWYAYRTGEFDRAFGLIGSALNASADPAMRYYHDLVKGHVLRVRGEGVAAVEAYRSALAAWPGGQSASVALMTLLLERGDRREAERLAEAVETAPVTQTDPWSTFGQGDFRAYPAMLAALRAQGR